MVIVPQTYYSSLSVMCGSCLQSQYPNYPTAIRTPTLYHTFLIVMWLLTTLHILKLLSAM